MSERLLTLTHDLCALVGAYVIVQALVRRVVRFYLKHDLVRRT